MLLDTISIWNQSLGDKITSLSSILTVSFSHVNVYVITK